MEMYRLMIGHLGPQKWWPAETELEVMIGAVLTQNTNWKNVEKAIGNLKEKRLLSLEALRVIGTEDLAREIRSAGYFNVKARRLKNLVDMIARQYDADLTLFLKEETATLREELLSVKGIGPETADSILLYAARRPVFVVDAYTYRILGRHGVVGDEASYDEMQQLFIAHLPDDEALFNEFHALIVLIGKNYCRRKPFCHLCPLQHWESNPPVS